MEDTVELEGISECDETFFALSYKGNRKAFSEGGIERDAHKRGGEVHTRGLSKEQVCVPCAVDRKHKSVSKIACLGAYLNGYLAWHNYINYAKEVVQEKVNILKEWLVNCGNNVSRQSIFNMPPIPC